MVYTKRHFGGFALCRYTNLFEFYNIVLTNDIIWRIISSEQRYCRAINTVKKKIYITSQYCRAKESRQTTEKKKNDGKEKWLMHRVIQERSRNMGFSVNAGLLDAMVLSVVQNDDTYGYEITQFLRKAVDISESTLYPVLRRLQKNDLLETYDKEYMGRNRRYYHVTPKGNEALEEYRNEWVAHKEKVDSILMNKGADDNE